MSKKRFGDFFDAALEQFRERFSESSKLIFFILFLPILVYSVLDGINYYYNGAGVGGLGWQIVFGILMAVVVLAYFLNLLVLVRFSLNKRTSFKKAFRGSIGLYGFFLLFSILFILGTFVGALLLIIPGIIFFVYFMFYVYVIAEGKVSPGKSFGESFRLVRGNFWRIFGYQIIMAVFVAIVGIIFDLPQFFYGMFFLVSGASSLSFGQYVLIKLLGLFGFLSNFITLPFFVYFFKEVYLDLKKRK